MAGSLGFGDSFGVLGPETPGRHLEDFFGTFWAQMARETPVRGWLARNLSLNLDHFLSRLSLSKKKGT